jgi:class 3 adenylate cyclase/pimeloyl-ACP methyl ester carboxylesterase
VEKGPVRYAKSGDLRIAYQQFGEGDIDLVCVPGFISNLDMIWEASAFAPVLERMSSFARCIAFDKRGTGLSDRDFGFGSLEERMDDIRAVMDDVGLERAGLFGISEGGPLSVLFAATYPDRVTQMAVYGSMARLLWAEDYPEGLDPALVPDFLAELEQRWGSADALRAFVQHIPKDDPEISERLARYVRGACTPRLAAQILAANIEIDIRPVLPTVHVPTLVLHSKNDPLVPLAAGKAIADGIPGAQLVVHDADYHMTFHGEKAWFLDEVEAFFTGNRPVAQPTPVDRFLGTVLFTDIVGSTEHAARVGDQEWHRLLDRHDKASTDKVTAYGGRIVKRTGDGLLAEIDSPSRAVECAIALRSAIDELGLQIRAGVHTGEFERRGDDLGGLGVNIGSRIMDFAGPGEVLVSRTVKDLTIGSGLQFSERGRHTLKGVPDEWELYALDA